MLVGVGSCGGIGGARIGAQNPGTELFFSVNAFESLTFVFHCVFLADFTWPGQLDVVRLDWKRK